MNVTRMLAWQVVLIVSAGLLFFAFVMRYPNVDALPPPTGIFFFLMLAGVSAGLVVIATRVTVRGKAELAAIVALVALEWLVWWYVVFYLWLNTYGS